VGLVDEEKVLEEGEGGERRSASSFKVHKAAGSVTDVKIGMNRRWNGLPYSVVLGGSFSTKAIGVKSIL